jgi:branched-subunit amino acid ABC-type transport system permease component
MSLADTVMSSSSSSFVVVVVVVVVVVSLLSVVVDAVGGLGVGCLSSVVASTLAVLVAVTALEDAIVEDF